MPFYFYKWAGNLHYCNWSLEYPSSSMNTSCKKVSDVVLPDPELMFKDPDAKPTEAHGKTSSIEFQGGFDQV